MWTWVSGGQGAEEAASFNVCLRASCHRHRVVQNVGMALFLFFSFFLFLFLILLVEMVVFFFLRRVVPFGRGKRGVDSQGSQESRGFIASCDMETLIFASSSEKCVHKPGTVLWNVPRVSLSSSVSVSEMVTCQGGLRCVLFRTQDECGVPRGERRLSSGFGATQIPYGRRTWSYFLRGKRGPPGGGGRGEVKCAVLCPPKRGLQVENILLKR